MYRRAHRTIGLTLIETTLVVATIALLVGLALPAVRSLIDSFQSEAGAKSMIQAALNSARTMAVSRRRYVGVRFQKSCKSNDPDVPLKGLLDAPQYMVFIVHDAESTGLGNGFQAVEGLLPIKLPDTMGVMDLTQVTGNGDVDELFELSNATTFSIVFSPSGRLLIHDVCTRNRDGKYEPDNTDSSKTSMDDVFNSPINIITYKRGLLIQDDYSTWGLEEEPSRKSFVIYDRNAFRRLYEKKTAWTQYLSGLSAESLYVSSYTGNLLSPE
jgi:type II secretory pathway pseudopilin PulG